MTLFKRMAGVDVSKTILHLLSEMISKLPQDREKFRVHNQKLKSTCELDTLYTLCNVLFLLQEAAGNIQCCYSAEHIYNEKPDSKRETTNNIATNNIICLSKNASFRTIIWFNY